MIRASKPLLTPRTLADAIGVSESALRRWVDNGAIRMSRTAGGHRRIPLQEAIRFIRESGATVVRPELLGLDIFPAADGTASTARSEDELFEALRLGNFPLARGIVLSGYLGGTSLAALFDGPIRAAMERLGELWRHDVRGILVEHRATDICLRIVAELRSLMPAVNSTAPLALGGAPEGDPYQLPSMMVAAVLADCGFRELNFGPETPVQLLGSEAAERDARLIWLSISSGGEVASLRQSIGELAGLLADQGRHFVIGGRRHAEVRPRGAEGLTAMASLGELSAFARGLLAGAPPRAS